MGRGSLLGPSVPAHVRLDNYRIPGLHEPAHAAEGIDHSPGDGPVVLPLGNRDYGGLTRQEILRNKLRHEEEGARYFEEFPSVH